MSTTPTTTATPVSHDVENYAHWVRNADIAFAASTGLQVPARCGAWLHYRTTRPAAVCPRCTEIRNGGAR